MANKLRSVALLLKSRQSSSACQGEVAEGEGDVSDAGYHYRVTAGSVFILVK